MNWKTLPMISSSRKNEARLEKPLRTSPEDETALTVVMSGLQRPRGTDIDETATTDTDADMTVEWTTPVIHPDSSCEDVEYRLTDDDQSGSAYADPYHSDEHDRHVAAANDAERRTEAIGTPPTETGLVPIGLPQLASPLVDADCVYAFVGESKWLKTQRREEVKYRNGSFGGGERRNDEWNGGRSEGLVSSVTKKPGHDYQPKNVIKLLSGESLGWWSAQKLDKRVRMRALVQGAVNDAHTRILLDTGTNVSVISERFAKQLRMREVRDHGRCMEIQGFAKGTMATTKRALAKVTLGWNQVYEYELWVMFHGAGVDIVLGTDFMIPAGVRLVIIHATARLPDEVEISLIKTQRMADTREEGPHVPDGPTELMSMGSDDERINTEGCRVSTRPSTAGTGDEHLGPPSHVPGASTSIAVGCQRGPTEDGGVEGEIYQRWLAAQPLAVERVPYTPPTKILRRPSESSEGRVSDRDDQAECATATTEPSAEMVAEVVHQEEARPKLTAHSDRVSEGSEVTKLKLEGAYLAAATVSEDWGDRDAPNASEHPGNDTEFEYYARELAVCTAVGGSPTDTAIHSRTRFEADHESSNTPDSLSAVVNDPRGDMFASGEADQSSLVPVFERRSFVDDICFGGESLDSWLETSDRLLSRFEECRISVSITKTFLTLGWINTSKTLFGRPTQFAVMLSPWHLVVHRVNKDDSAFAQLLHSTITNSVGLDEALQRVAPPSKRNPMVRMDPVLLYARLPNDHQGFVLSFDGSAKTPKHGRYGSCAWILWRLPDWKIEIAASAYLENTTVNQAEYMGMNEGLRAAQAYGVTDLVVVGDSRLAIQQSLAVIACLKESLLTQLNIHRELVARFQSVRYLHVTREYNPSADSLAGETLAAKEAKTTLTEESKSKLEQLNRIHEVIYGEPNREVTQATQSTNKRVRFADTHDEDSEALPVEPEPPDRPNDATTESSHVENGETPPRAAERPPSAEYFDPLEVQEERCRRVGRAQDEELRRANLK
ncbi:unnamed protein product [Phytophthora fragariaefolia]|uniref:Unnamed protein product n=1 Tax=Phytophthora fragariaefolia TaxID=1490495 RepID=A0A9W7CMB6_9STRA|nr:unnamed protein product [Phytophthora fragariaefolia]